MAGERKSGCLQKIYHKLNIRKRIVGANTKGMKFRSVEGDDEAIKNWTVPVNWIKEKGIKQSELSLKEIFEGEKNLNTGPQPVQKKWKNQELVSKTKGRNQQKRNERLVGWVRVKTALIIWGKNRNRNRHWSARTSINEHHRGWWGRITRNYGAACQSRHHHKGRGVNKITGSAKMQKYRRRTKRKPWYWSWGKYRIRKTLSPVRTKGRLYFTAKPDKPGQTQPEVVGKRGGVGNIWLRNVKFD